MLEAFFVEADAAPDDLRARVTVAAARLPGAWQIGQVLPDPRGGTRNAVELFPTTEHAVAPTEAWSLAHDLAAAIVGSRVEPVFAGDIDEREVADPSAMELVALEGSVGGVAPVDVRWHLDHSHVREAHAWLREHGIEPGDGVRIGHPDTGYTEHVEIWAAQSSPIDLEGSENLLEPGKPPFDPESTGPLRQPGHGTRTASVIVAQPGIEVRRDPPGPTADLLGVAPCAHVVPFRVTKSVVIFGWQGRLARAIEAAVRAKCQVISMSLGGIGGRRLNRAIELAEQNGVIVVSAAGNGVRFVVAPATHPLVVACAATGPDGRPWRGSSRGRAVDITAPGHEIWVAGWTDGEPSATPGSGTSFATATVAGAAALWLCAHRGALRHRRAADVPKLFRRALKSTARASDDLPPRGFGAGMLDCHALVRAELGVETEAVAEVQESPELRALESLLDPGDAAPIHLEARASTLGPAAALDDQHLAELVFHLTVDPDARERWRRSSGVTEGPANGETPPHHASPSLRRKLEASRSTMRDRSAASVHSYRHGSRPIASDARLRPGATTMRDTRLLFSDPKLAQEFLDRLPELTPSVRGGFEKLPAPPSRDEAARTIAAMNEGTWSPRGDGFEAIIERFTRPVQLVQDGTFGPPADTFPESGELASRLLAAKGVLDAAIPRVGRIDLRNHRSAWVGTGWMVAPDVVVTNRHVAESFARPDGAAFAFHTFIDGRTTRAHVDWRHEYGRGTESVFRVRKVMWIEPDPSFDAALLQIEPSGADGEAQPDVVTLMTEAEIQQIGVGRWMAVIGYPARDSRNDFADQQRIFDGIFDVKRLAAGQITAIRKDGLVTHDATTLGGCSGSALIDLQTGKAIALHFGGIEGEANFAVQAPRVAAIVREHVA